MKARSLVGVVLVVVGSNACDGEVAIRCEGRDPQSCRIESEGLCGYAFNYEANPKREGCFPYCEPNDPECPDGTECLLVSIDNQPESAVGEGHLCVPPDFTGS